MGEGSFAGGFRDTGLPSLFLGVFGIYALWLVLLSLALSGWWDPESRRAAWGGELAALGVYVSFAGAAGAQLARRRRPVSFLWAPREGVSPLAWSWLLGLTVLSLAATIVIAVADDAARAAWFPQFRETTSDLNLTSPMSWLIIVLWAPVVEELVFRGYLLHRWARRWGTSFALIATSLLFAVLHPNPIGHFFGAVILGLVTLKTGSLVAPVGIHLGNNLLAMVLGVAALGFEQDATNKALTGTELGMAVLLALAVMGFLVWRFAHYWPKKSEGSRGPHFEGLSR